MYTLPALSLSHNPMPTGIYCVHITQFHDDIKLRGEMPSKSTLKYFTDESRARAWIREWFIEQNFMEEYELDENQIKKRFRKRKLEEWCDSKYIPLESCPNFDAYIKALIPGECVPYVFEIKMTEIAFEDEPKLDD